VAARQADIITLMPPITGRFDPYQFSAEAYAEKIGWVRDEAGHRFDQIEFGAQLLHVAVTDDPEAAFEQFFQRQTRRLDPAVQNDPAVRAALRTAPLVAIGTMDEVCAHISRVRDDLGLSYFMTPMGVSAAEFAPVAQRLTGR
jgi:hypothetical protein